MVARKTSPSMLPPRPTAISRSSLLRPVKSCPGLQAVDAVAAGTVEAAHTTSYYFVGKDPTYAIGTAIPFGLNSRLTNAWYLRGQRQYS